MTPAADVVGRDLYFRRMYGKEAGPVLYVRVWDADLFIKAESERGKADTLAKADRYTIEASTAGAFERERRK